MITIILSTEYEENNINKILKDDGVNQSRIDINEFVNLNSVYLKN